MNTSSTHRIRPRTLFRPCLAAALSLLSAASAWAWPQQNSALQFDGVNDYATISRPIQDDFTIEFWMKKTTPEAWTTTSVQWWNGRGLVDAEVANITNDFGVSYLNGSILFGTGGPDRTIQSGQSFVVADGQWHHIAAVRLRSSGQKWLYVDGQLAATGVGGTQALTAPPAIKLGAIQVLTSNHFFAGSLDEVRIWNTARSQAEIQAGMNACAISPSAVGLVGLYRFDEGSGLLAADASPQQNHAALVNGPAWVTGAGPGGSIEFTSQPADVRTCPTGSAQFTVAATGSGAVSYHWRKGGVPIDTTSEGNPSAATPTLLITSFRPSDSGVYDCLVTDDCGSTPSDPARLTICPMDFNCDGDLNADDLSDYITCYFSRPMCAAAEFNGDGDLNADDLSDFITAYFIGCP